MIAIREMLEIELGSPVKDELWNHLKEDGIVREVEVGEYNVPQLVEAARELFEKEMTLYPDNYYAHRTWWQSVRTHNRSQYESELVNDLRRIEQAVVGNPLDYQFIQVSAYLDLHKEEQARIILLTMLQEAPQARFTWFAARLYRYKTFAQNITGVGPTAVDDAIVAAVRKHPTSPLARIGLLQYIHEEVVPSEVLRRIDNALLPDNRLQ